MEVYWINILEFERRRERKTECQEGKRNRKTECHEGKRNRPRFKHCPIFINNDDHQWLRGSRWRQRRKASSYARRRPQRQRRRRVHHGLALTIDVSGEAHGANLERTVASWWPADLVTSVNDGVGSSKELTTSLQQRTHTMGSHAWHQFGSRLEVASNNCRQQREEMAMHGSKPVAH